jgi:Lon protease-like protein
MYEIPLFPLNTVLFPGMPLPLHIFEERYKEMIGRCLQERLPFGVVLVQDDIPESDLPSESSKPHTVGCTAEIAQVQPLEEGRMLIMTIGRERFRIVDLKYDQPYLVGLVETAPLVREDEELLDRAAAHLHPLVTEYLTILADVGEVEFDVGQVPHDAEALVYLAATLIQLPQEDKQHLLATDRASTLLKRLYHHYKGEVALMRWIPKADQGIFSSN